MTEDSRQIEDLRSYLYAIASNNLDRALRPKVGVSDLVQQTLLEAHRDRSQFRGKGRQELGGWLRRILINKLLNLRRYFSAGKRDVAQERSLNASRGSSSGPLIGRIAADGSTPSVKAMRDEALQRVVAALETLTEAQRQALLLHYYQGLPLDEVGERMGKTRTQVAALACRGMKALRARLRADASSTG